MSTSGTVASFITPSNQEIQNFESPLIFNRNDTDTERKLAAFDPSLANTYREIGQVYHGTTADPTRAAMALMRQVFDHFFTVLAPDDLVRQSPYWHEKNEEEADLITRRERITYAAFTHVRDRARAETMVANITVILDAYKILNKIHERGSISEEQARTALKTMKEFIENWTDAIG